MFGWKSDFWFCLLNYRSEVVIEDITHSYWNCNGSVVKLNWVRDCSCNILIWNYSFHSFPNIFNVIPSSHFQSILYNKSVYLPSLMKKGGFFMFCIFMKLSLYLWIFFWCISLIVYFNRDWFLDTKSNSVLF